MEKSSRGEEYQAKYLKLVEMLSETLSDLYEGVENIPAKYLPVKRLELVENILGGLDEDIATKYLGQLSLGLPYDIGWQTYEPWLEQLCRNIRELTLAIQEQVNKE